MSSESLHDPEDYANWRESWLGSETEQLERAAIFRLAGSLRSKRILEIGCGDGTYSIAASLSAAQVTAVDISAEMLSSARRRADEEAPSLTGVKRPGNNFRSSRTCLRSFSP